MFYVVSKIFWVLAQPLSIVAFLVTLGVLLSYFERRRPAVLAQAGALFLLILCAFTNAGALLLGPLENRFPRDEGKLADISNIIVLGGSTLARVSTSRQVAELNEAGDRLTEAVALAQQFPEAKLVFTGGAGILDQGEAEAETARRFWLKMGLEVDAIVFEAEARNTDENASLTAKLLTNDGQQSILVTSAFHMPRSMGLFRRKGLEMIPWSVDYRTTGNESFGFDFANPVQNLNNVSVATKEWAGLAVYRLTGRIDALFPSP
jgi:uncharacterized SAM-binding protein YcdF (DUF218 family)